MTRVVSERLLHVGFSQLGIKRDHAMSVPALPPDQRDVANGESGATDDRLTSEHVGVPNDASGGGSVSDGHVDVLLNESKFYVRRERRALLAVCEAAQSRQQRRSATSVQRDAVLPSKWK